jgi:hypothetical protein
MEIRQHAKRQPAFVAPDPTRLETQLGFEFRAGGRMTYFLTPPIAHNEVMALDRTAASADVRRGR